MRDASENPQFEMTAFKRFTLSSEPLHDIQKCLTLTGYNFQNGQYEPYNNAAVPPGDQRFLMPSGPFDRELDSSIIMVFAVMLTCWYDHYNLPDAALVLAEKWVQRLYALSWHFTGFTERRAEKGNVRPGLNPVRNNVTIYYFLRFNSGYNKLIQYCRATGERTPSGK